MALSAPLEIPRGFLEFETILRRLPSVLNGSHVPAGITHVTEGRIRFLRPTPILEALKQTFIQRGVCRPPSTIPSIYESR